MPTGRYEDREIDPVFRRICGEWNAKIRQAIDHRRDVFDADATECQNFYNGPRSWDELMVGIAVDSDDPGYPVPDFKVSVNKAFEFVTLFGPSLYYESPVRSVKPRMPVQVPPAFFPDPYMYQALLQAEQIRVMQDGLRGVLLESLLNWNTFEFGFAQESRDAIDEALIKGRGCLWTELYQPPAASFKVVRSVWESVDDLLIDPDAPSLDRATWIARRRVQPVWQVERDYGLRPGSLRGNAESQDSQSLLVDDSRHKYNRQRGLTNDLIVFYQVWSKTGVGGRLVGVPPNVRQSLEPFGDYAYLVIADSVPFPLNLGPDKYNDPSFQAEPKLVFDSVAWPTPFWVDDTWPVTCLDFHKIHNCPWPMPHLKAGMGELKFLNWVMSFLMGRIRNSCRDFIALKKSLGEEIKATILGGKDLSLLELEADHGTISELVGFLQHPEVNGDVWTMIDAVERNFDKRVGLSELMYGGQTSTQIRSAAEVNIRSQNMSIRPDDMAKQVESWQSEVAAKEAVAARYHLRGADVAALMGGMGAFAWDTYVSTTDPVLAARQLEYRIEAGSTRRPNKEWEAKTMSDLFQYVGPILQQYATMTGDITPMNNLLADFAKSRALDPGRYQLRMAAVPPQPTTDEEQQDDPAEDQMLEAGV
jgi:hypothetical protein